MYVVKKSDIFIDQKVGFTYDGEVMLGHVVAFSDDKPETHINIKTENRIYEKSIDNLLGLL